MEPWTQFHSNLTLEDVLAEVSTPQDTTYGLLAVSEWQLADVQNLALAEQASLDAHLLLHQDVPLSMEEEGSGKSESEEYNLPMPIVRGSFVDIQLNEELMAPASRPKDPEPATPRPCHLQANSQVMADELVDVVVEEPSNIASEVASSACSGVRGQMHQTSADSSIDTEMLAPGRMAPQEATSDYLPTRAPNPEPWKPSEFARGFHVTESQENLDGDLSAAMLRAESRTAGQPNGPLMPAIDRPQNPEPWLPSEASRLPDGVEGDRAKAILALIDDEQNLVSTEDSAAVETHEQPHNKVMSLLRQAKEEELQQRQRALGCERALAIVRAVAGREQHIKVLHAKIASVNRKVTERQEAARQLEYALHASRRQADDLTTHLETIRACLASFEMHCRSQEDWQDLPTIKIGRSLPLDTSLKSATSEHSTTCTAQDLGLRGSLLFEMTSNSLGVSGGTSA